MQMQYVGLRVPVPENTTCANHPELEAVRGYVTSVTSTVNDTCAEHTYLCEECAVLHQIILDSAVAAEIESNEENIGDCEWCKAANVPVYDTRDYEEGSSGCVYDVCRNCINEQNKAIEREEEIYRRDNQDTDINDDDNGELFSTEDGNELDQEAEDGDVRYLEKD